MKKAKKKPTSKTIRDYASEAKALHDSFLLKGFTSDQSFDLVMLILSKSLR